VPGKRCQRAADGNSLRVAGCASQTVGMAGQRESIEAVVAAITASVEVSGTPQGCQQRALNLPVSATHGAVLLWLEAFPEVREHNT